MSQLPSFEIKHYDFDHRLLASLQDLRYAQELWPVVYLLSDGRVKEAYVGETTDARSRFDSHLRNAGKNKLTSAHLIASDAFNKSATLDMEANLIKYLSADGKYNLINGNIGLANHNYYDKKSYQQLFRLVWDQLRALGIARHALEHIDNSDLFKYSPYKTLSFEQRKGLEVIVQSLLDGNARQTIIEGGAGTGKTILAIFLFKLLHTPIEVFNFRDFGDEDQRFIELVRQLKAKYPAPRTALVIPMASFRNTIRKVFRHIKGLNAKMVIGPSELADSRYDLVLVDESHRLRRRVNLGTYFRTFDETCTKLGLDKQSCSELDWVLQQSDNAVFFYDENQSIKPSDTQVGDFQRLKALVSARTVNLREQFRVRGGTDYVAFIHRLLSQQIKPTEKAFRSRSYELMLYTSLSDMLSAVAAHDKAHGLSRMVAGYAWPWVSKNNPGVDDIQIEGISLKWNSVANDWVNSPNAPNEVGCIHTTQGYDLNYTGIIFGPEIGYDPKRKEIIIRPEAYHDKNGKNTLRKQPDVLKAYILNIYKTLMLRGIRGTYLYVCDDALRDYFAQFIPVADADEPATIARAKADNAAPLVPFENSVPFYDLSAAAGDFSEQQQVSDDEKEFITVPEGIRVTEDHFACRVIGESMNKIIPNGSICLFKKYQGGSRSGLIVLAQHTDRQDTDFGSQYTVKEYHSTKYQGEEGWHHQAITLMPQSDDPRYQQLRLADDELSNFSVIGIFERVLTAQ